MNDEQELRPADLHYRPQLITTNRVKAANAAFDRLLAEPPRGLRRVHWSRQRLEFSAHDDRTWLSEDDQAFLRGQGFRPLAHVLSQSPGSFGDWACRYELWIDPTCTIKVEVSGATSWGQCAPDELTDALGAAEGTVFIATYFDDATSILMLPDDLVTDEFQSERREAMSGTEDVTRDLPRFLERRDELLADGKVPLPCADVVMYAKHHELHATYFMSPSTIESSLLMEFGLEAATAFASILLGACMLFWSGTSGGFVIAFGIAGIVRNLFSFARSFGDRYDDDLAEALDPSEMTDTDWSDAPDWVH